MSSCAGFEKSFKMVPAEKRVALFGGTLDDVKLELIQKSYKFFNKIAVGGETACHFLNADNKSTGSTPVKTEYSGKIRDLIAEIRDSETELIMPSDHIASVLIEPEVTIRMVGEGEDVPENMICMDIGMDTVNRYSSLIASSGLVIICGIMGNCETETFCAGTSEVYKAFEKAEGITALIVDTSVTKKSVDIPEIRGADFEFSSSSDFLESLKKIR